MKIGIISDVHGNYIALSYVINDLLDQNINDIIILGDIVMEGPMPKESIDALNNFNILGWVRGNTDMWFDKIPENLTPTPDKLKEISNYVEYAIDNLSEDYIVLLKNKPMDCIIEIEDYSILCVHGTPKSMTSFIDDRISEEAIRFMIKDIKQDLILCGHSHHSYIGELDDKRIFNVGSVGIPLDGDIRASYGILQFSKDGIRMINRRVEYPLNELFKIAERREFPNIETYKKMINSAC